METYIVKPKQNIFDVAVFLYGSVEGLLSLLIDNPTLSLDADLQPGTKIQWNPDGIIHPNVVNTFLKDGYYPANSDRQVYARTNDLPTRIQIIVPYSVEFINFVVSGSGKMTIDYGDNSNAEEIALSGAWTTINHNFNISSQKIVKISGNFQIFYWDLSGTYGEIQLLDLVSIDRVVAKRNNVSLNGLFMCNQTPTIVLSKIPQENLDNFLKYAAEHVTWQKACRVATDVAPSGVYKEPEKNSSGKYIVRTGMEAVYLLTNKQEYNSPNAWVININNQVYSYDQSQAGWILPIYLY